MQGFYNQILNIDLTRETQDIQPVEDGIYETHLGGKGLASWLLFGQNPKGVNSLSPDNHLIFATGAVTGSATWGSSRYGVFTKSPLTGFYAESYSGGRVPEAISATGFDAIVIRGKARDLSVLEIGPEGVVFHDGADLAGKDTFETEKILSRRKCAPKTRGWKSGAVVIGPAAENGIRFSIIKNDGWRCAGRAGTGTVMGSKNIKAIVFSGNRRRSFHDPRALLRLSKEMASLAKDSPVVHAYKSMGTSQMVKVMNNAGAFPTKYWSRGRAPHWENISADALHNQCEVHPHACAKCFLACGRMTRVLQGPHSGLVLEGPEYETLYSFGGLCMVDCVEEIVHLNHVCDSLGMDTITAGNLCAFAMAAFEKGKSDYDIQFGDARAIAVLLNLIARREGIGNLLSQGIVPTAREWGMEDFAVHVKGMEPAGYDPRVLKGMGLAYAASDRGACHLRATFYKPELSGMMDRNQIEGKARLFIDFEDRLTLFDTMILCKFYRDLYPWELLGEMITAATGIDGSRENLAAIAGKIASTVRKFNLREGMTPADESLPRAFYMPLEDSRAVITQDEMGRLMAEYIGLRGWGK
ncbi:MAG: aldehyde ferredoxin oxidoreductase family protein [Proteobacteria bacterium]|nr:aldehyde ferredoxin oxidoreductase family protein [Desulfobacula sp.]MBU3954446.1 aldehyde ferredoxin oxidoreductase family protein [Pseudomonadota bacterium]MBU4132442.1 aldehyde ferredoxin oxidoreductase family protein [Pseudomonadota bacterium]